MLSTVLSVPSLLGGVWVFLQACFNKGRDALVFASFSVQFLWRQEDWARPKEVESVCISTAKLIN